MELSSFERGAMAYFDSAHDCPMEIILAAGFQPHRLLGLPNFDTQQADQYLSPFLCPAARGMLSEAITKYTEWEGIVISHGCDATHRFADLYRKHIPLPIYWLNNPMNRNLTASVFFQKELRRMVAFFEGQFGLSITRSDLIHAIQYSNGIKSLLRAMARLRATHDIPNPEYFAVCRTAVQFSPPGMDQLGSEPIKDYLRAKLAEWQSRPPFPDTKIPIFLTGSDISHPAWFQLLEEANLRAVRDDLSIGERFFARTIPLDIFPDPIEALAHYYFMVPPPPTKNIRNRRLDFILTGCFTPEAHIKGLVSQSLKFCEPYAFDAVDLVKAVKAAGFPAIHLEREYTQVISAQLKTRLEAFAEMV